MVYRFHDISFRPDERLLTRAGERIRLTAKVNAVLLRLVESEGRIVSKDELLDAVWGDTVVSESSLSQCVRRLRVAIGDSPGGANAIETVYGRGYRFDAAVEVEVEAAADESARDAWLIEPFVGREAEMERLRGWLASLATGRGGLVALVGEPGIGKTRTADEVGREARRAGAAVRVGRCFEGQGAPAYWPWRQILRDLAEEPVDGLVDAVGPLAPDLALVVPELAGLTGSAEAPVSPEGLSAEHARFRSFDAVARALGHLASVRPQVILLDDLQDADPSSLQLLRYLAAELSDRPVLLLATCRAGDEGGAALQELARIRSCEWVELGRLSREQVGDYLDAVAGDDARLRSRADELFARSEGHPLFVVELLRQMRVGGSGEVPQGVREMIQLRLGRLPEEARRVLQLAAVWGPRFELAGLAAVSGFENEKLLAALDAAEAAGLVADLETAATHYRFGHSLVRDVLYSELPSALRRQAHRRAGEHLEDQHAEGTEAVVSELAHHWSAAGSDGEPERAFAYRLAAARAAARQLAFEQAVLHYRLALDWLETEAPDRHQELSQVGVELCRAQNAAWQIDAARETAIFAAERARIAGDASGMARAVLAMPKVQLHGTIDAERERLSLAALEVLGPAPSAIRGELLTDLANTLYWARDRARPRACHREAVEIAESLGDAALLAWVRTVGHIFLEGPARTDERLSSARDAVSWSRRAGNRELEFYGIEQVVNDCLEKVDVSAAEQAASEIDVLVEEARLPWASRCRSLLSLLRGDLAATERLLTSLPVDLSAGASDLRVQYVGPQFALLRLYQGRAAEVLPLMRTFVARVPGLLAWRAGLARVALDAGEIEEARSEYEGLATRDFEDLGDDLFTPAALNYLAELAAAFADRRRAEVLLARLRPYSGLGLMIPRAVIFLGVAERPLGLLAAALGRHDEALDLLDAAVEATRRIGARPLLALTQVDRARVLDALDRPDPAQEARNEARLLAQATGAALPNVPPSALPPLA